jgi:tRNA dimethylallyltransferase
MTTGQATLLVITGPTAIGKTGVAIRLAQELNTEILSADSRQFFREMSIGTAKPTKEELNSIPHHFINSLSIKDDYDAGKYEQDALFLLNKLFLKYSVVILCGGSGMYVDAVCKGFDQLPEVEEAQRKKLNDIFETQGIHALQSLLREHDPDHYQYVDLNNPHRLIRALEITLSTGIPYSSLRRGKTAERPFRIVKIGLNTDRDLLYKRINERVDAMMTEGLLEEVKALNPYKKLNALQTVGYKELFDHLEGKYSLEDAVSLIKQNTRRFSKRQMTWFRKDESIVWLDPLKPEFELGDILKRIQ